MSEPSTRSPQPDVVIAAPGLADDEHAISAFRPDRRRFFSVQAFWTAMQLAILLFVGQFLASGMDFVVLIGVVLAAQIFRAFLSYRRVFSTIWYLTDRRLIGPRGRSILLLEILQLSPFLGDVHITRNDGKRLRISHLADPISAIEQIEAARHARAEVAT
ncbi:hypothetical protein ERN12_10365 [Rhodobacteraceae bacterium]|nr:hypothetical protein ERN12_10365 [Paracoccaceae bacterium]